MEEINSLMQGFSVALTPYNVGLMLVGVILGVLIETVPAPKSMVVTPSARSSSVVAASALAYGVAIRPSHPR